MMCPGDREPPGTSDIPFKLICTFMELEVVFGSDNNKRWYVDFAEPLISWRIKFLPLSGIQYPGKRIFSQVCSYSLTSRGILWRGHQGRIFHQAINHSRDVFLLYSLVERFPPF